MKNDPADLGRSPFFVNPEGFQEVPGDRFAFTVGVGCENQLVGAFQGFLQQAQLLFRFCRDSILGQEAVFDIDRAVFARQVANVAVGGQDLVALAEKFFDGLGLGRGFYNNQGIRHKFCSSRFVRNEKGRRFSRSL